MAAQWIKDQATGKILNVDGKIAVDLSCCCDCLCGCGVPFPTTVKITMRGDGECAIWDGLSVTLTNDQLTSCTWGFSALLHEFDSEWLNFQWFDGAYISFDCCTNTEYGDWRDYRTTLSSTSSNPCLVLDGVACQDQVVDGACSPFRLVSKHYSITQSIGNCCEPCPCTLGGGGGDIWFELEEVP